MTRLTQLTGLGAIALAACAPERDPAANDVATAQKAPDQAAPAVPPAAQPPALAVDGEGLRLIDAASGSARPIAFGTPQGAVMGMLAFRGPAETGRNEECGAGPIDSARWPDGLSLNFQEGRFAGWWISEDTKGTITTPSGIGTGSTRADLENAHSVEVAESTLGTEFHGSGIGGLLEGAGRDSKITALWAGATCVFR
ncbi:MAG TPA: hypothetical protein VNA29_06255 [Sphingomicrobium sp.]|nr:hypothetical protein [Sphingomicrobium sp.]